MESRRWFGALAIGLLASGTALGQNMDPLTPVSKDFPAVREWVELLTRSNETDWEAKLSVRMRFRSPMCKDKCPVVDTSTFVLPWVNKSATQYVAAPTVKMRGWVGLDEIPQPPTLFDNPLGRQAQQGLRMDAPPGGTFNFFQLTERRDSRGSLAQDAFGSGYVRGMFIQAEVTYRCLTSNVRLNEAEAATARWPKTWPEEAQAAFAPQAYLDTAFDAVTGNVYDLDQSEIRDYATAILKTNGVQHPQDLPPTELAREVAGAVLPGLLSRGRAVAISGIQWTPNGPAVKLSLSDPGPGGSVPPQPRVIAGFYMRDVISVMEDGAGNDAERACVLAAVYRSLGLPARVMIGFEAGRDDNDKLARRLSDLSADKVGRTPQEIRKQIDERDQKAADRNAKNLQALRDRAATQTTVHWPAFRFPDSVTPRKPEHVKPVQGPIVTANGPANTPNSPGMKGKWPGGMNGKAPQATKGQWPGSTAPMPPSKPKSGVDAAMKRYLDEFSAQQGRLLTARFWVEFGVFDPEKGLGWIPVDPGSGAEDWRFGTVEDSERVVVVATNFWPTTIRHLAPFCFQTKYDEIVYLTLGRDGALTGMQGQPSLSKPGYQDRMPAGLWGMFMGPEENVSLWQEIGFEARRPSRRGDEMPLTRPTEEPLETKRPTPDADPTLLRRQPQGEATK